MHKGVNQFRDMMREDRKSQKKPDWVLKLSWKSMTDYQDSEDLKKQSKQNKSNASSGHKPTLHIGGSITIAKHRRQLVKSLPL